MGAIWILQGYAGVVHRCMTTDILEYGKVAVMTATTFDPATNATTTRYFRPTGRDVLFSAKTTVYYVSQNPHFPHLPNRRRSREKLVQAGRGGTVMVPTGCAGK